jgi:predicted nucleic acid-binding protein
MYAAGANHPLRQPCRAALEVAVNRRVSLVTDAEVLQEILYRYFSVGKPEFAQSVYRVATRLCDDILPVSERATGRALELLLRYGHLSPRDAVHIATMEEGGLRRLLSTDRDFDRVDEVQRVDPVDFVG